MNWLIANKKLTIIIVFVFLCGLILQFSRSDFILNSTKNVSTINNHSDLLTPATASYAVASDADYCIVFNESSLKLKNNITQTLSYIQKTFKTFDASLGKVDYNDCPNILLTTSYLEHLGTVEEIEQYVFNGGNLFLLQTLEPNSHFQVLYRSLGITNYQDFTVTKGVHLLSNILIGAKDKTFLENSIEDSSLNIVLEDSITPLVENMNKQPLLWKTKYGSGHFMVFNSTFLTEKDARGFLVGILSVMEDTYIYPIFNVKIYFIDDFPAPIPKGRHDILYNEFKQDTPTFFQNIWWPDMLEIANRNNMIYTGGLIETYTDKVYPPFDQIPDNELDSLIRFGRDLTRSNGEIGLHGYNHQSLTMDSTLAATFGYNAWPSIENMEGSLQEVTTYMKKAFPAYKITSYIPPSNVLSKEGRKILKESIPSLVTISSLYIEDDSNRSYVQEFEIAPDAVVEMPRISSGYVPNVANEWEIANTITSLGVFSHFIHPDDVISEDRSQGGWTEMRQAFEHFMEDIHARYPWLQAMTATDAAYHIANTLHSQATFNYTATEINGTIEHFNQPQSFVLRTLYPVHEMKNGDFEKIDDNTYLITAQKEKFSILLKEDAK